ncbi:unnamed protein product [Cuscuta epithymum]|uniref:Uncharacterized protein n=1 Tax=Cuscuta epithymum TaxID=186058 RepID=A0AAV0ETB3_9ASTE|nr:unnamed protein product [Cuscuta epithymum]
MTASITPYPHKSLIKNRHIPTIDSKTPANYRRHGVCSRPEIQNRSHPDGKLKKAPSNGTTKGVEKSGSQPASLNFSPAQGKLAGSGEDDKAPLVRPFTKDASLDRQPVSQTQAILPNCSHGLIWHLRLMSSSLDLIHKTDYAYSGCRSRSWSVRMKFQKHFWCSNLLSESVF